MNSGEMVRGNVRRGLLERCASWELILTPHPALRLKMPAELFSPERVQLR